MRVGRAHRSTKKHNRSKSNDRQNADSRSQSSQPEKHRCRDSAGEDRGNRGRVRLRQILAGAGRIVRRGIAALSGGPFDLHAPTHDAGVEGQCGRGAVCSRRAGAASAPRRAGHPQHLRHGNGAAEQPAASVFPPRQPSLPQRTLSAALSAGRRGQGSSLPRVRRTFLRAVCGGAGLQFSGRVRKMRRHRRRPHGGSRHAGAGRLADHRRRRGRSVEQPDVVADDGHLPGDGRADRRALPRSDGTGKGRRVPRPGREKAHLLPQQKLQSGGRAGFHLLQRRLHRGKRPFQSQG